MEIKNRGRVVIMLIAVWGCFAFTAFAQTKNGFDLSNSSIPLDQILSGGPPRDGIPSIDKPKFIPASKVEYLKDDDIVIGLVHNGRARAYPLRILIWHEIINDTIEGKSFAITYCPLCGTSMVFDRSLDGKTLSFGVSGLLYQSDVLMYDRESESLWSQIAMKAISGPLAGSKLNWLPSKHITWKAWQAKYPESEVLSTETGFKRNYKANAYASYFDSDETLFPVFQTRKELPQKEWVIGVIINGIEKAYPVNELPANKTFQDMVGGQKIFLSYSPENRYPVVVDSKGDTVAFVMAFWFAWQAFYPNTELWKP